MGFGVYAFSVGHQLGYAFVTVVFLQAFGFHITGYVVCFGFGAVDAEVAKIGLLDAEDVEDFCVVRVPKTYPAYFGSYDRFDVIRKYLDRFTNLFLVGRNGMHKYNNQDHSMLTAMTAVENILNGVATKDNIWAINTEMDYHEEKTAD